MAHETVSAASSPSLHWPLPSPIDDDDEVGDGQAAHRRSVSVYSVSSMDTGHGEQDRPSMSRPVREDAVPEAPLEEKVAMRPWRKNSLNAATLLADFGSVAVPLALVGVIIAVWNLDNALVRDVPLGTWRNVITILATLYPIIFAAVAGRMTSAAAQWKLEKGTSMVDAEILHGSRTVGGVLLTLIQLRYINILGFFLFLLWGTSPLGAQSFLRIVSTTVRNEYHPAAVKYEPTGNRAYLGDGFTWSTAAGPLMKYVQMNTYSTMLLSSKSRKMSPMDLWGNIKVPILQYNGEGPNYQDGNWTPVSEVEGEVPYYSLFGTPLELPTTPGNTTFIMESSYIGLNCSKLRVHDAIAPIEQIHAIYDPPHATNVTPNVDDATWKGRDTRQRSDLGTSSGGWAGAALWSIAVDRFINRSITRSSSDSGEVESMGDSEPGPARLLFQVPAKPWAQNPSFRSIEVTCEIKQIYAESKVHCSSSEGNSKDCAVIAQRPSMRQHTPETVTQLSDPLTFHVLSSELPRQIPRLGMKQSLGDLSLQYLVDPFVNKPYDVRNTQLGVMDSSSFGRRLSQVINTYISVCMFSTYGTTGTVSPDAVQLDGEKGELVEHVTISQLWAILAVVALAILVLSGIVSVVLTHLSKGPEVLGYVSTIVRDSKFIDYPEETRWLGGLHFTNMMRERSIRLGMIQPTADEMPLLGVGETDRVEGLDTIPTEKASESSCGSIGMTSSARREDLESGASYRANHEFDTRQAGAAGNASGPSPQPTAHEYGYLVGKDSNGSNWI